MEYAFLDDFDLLSDTRSDVRLRVWAKPASRILMDQYFKMERAQEEITRLNVEIPRLTMYIHDEEEFLLRQEELLLVTDPLLSHQFRLRRFKLIRSNDLHIRRLTKLTSLPGFRGKIVPGTSVEAALHHRENDAHNREAAQEYAGGDEEEEGDVDEQEGAEVADAFCLVAEGLGS